MRLESARDLKQELLTEVVLPLSRFTTQRRVPSGRISEAALSVAQSVSLANAAAPRQNVPEVPRFVALGVAGDRRDYRLAIRVQRSSLLHSDLLQLLVEKARGEVDVRLIGRVDKRFTDRPRAGARRAGAPPPPGRNSIALGDVRVISADTPWHRKNARPLLIGTSVGHVDVTAGTIGAFVERAGRKYILSNNHVLANEDRGKRGDSILQRGAIDGGRSPRDKVATLRHWVPLKEKGANLVDAALGEITTEYDPVRLRALVNGADRKLAGVGPEFVDEGDVVYKVGRTTGPTTGRVTAFDLDGVVISFDQGNLRFDGQIEIEGSGDRAFSDGGDSGSLILDAGMNAVGLLFAGSERGGSNDLGLTYANPIHTVLKALKADLLLT